MRCNFDLRFSFLTEACYSEKSNLSAKMSHF